MAFRYYPVNRPPTYAQVPAGGIAREVWERPQRVQGDDGMSWRAHGWIDYAERLSPEQVESYELVPADEAERATSWFAKQRF